MRSSSFLLLLAFLLSSSAWAQTNRLHEVKLPANSIRMEYLLEEAPAAKVVDFVKDDYPQVEFTLHPTLNGFYARGSREDLLQIKRELGDGSREPEPSSPPNRERLVVRHGNTHHIRAVLQTIVPDVIYNIDVGENTLIVEGAPGALDQVCEMLPELDVPQRMSMEYLLEEAPAEKVVDFLKAEFTQVDFILHSQMNGFYAFGTREDLLQIKRGLIHGGPAPVPPPPPIRERLPVRFGDVHEIRSRLRELVPDVTYGVDLRENVLIVEGLPGAIDMVREMLTELDRPEE